MLVLPREGGLLPLLWMYAHIVTRRRIIVVVAEPVRRHAWVAMRRRITAACENAHLCQHMQEDCYCSYNYKLMLLHETGSMPPCGVRPKKRMPPCAVRPRKLMLPWCQIKEADAAVWCQIKEVDATVWCQNIDADAAGNVIFSVTRGAVRWLQYYTLIVLSYRGEQKS